MTAQKFGRDLLMDIIACKDPTKRVDVADGYAKTLEAMLKKAANGQQEG